MSYDIFVVECDPNSTPDDIFDVLKNSGLPPNPQAAEQNQYLADALMARNPSLVARGNENIEISEPESATGIQIGLYPNCGTISVPYWHHGETAQVVFTEIWTYLEIIQEASGRLICDFQIEKIIDLATDFEVVLSTYTGTTGES